MLRFNVAEAIFTNGNEANLCLDIMNRVQDKNKYVLGSINNRSIFCKGVISDWPFGISHYGRRLKIRPYIEPVKQCYNCFKYDHLKSMCKSQTICIICGETAHGKCKKSTKCRNCGLDYRSSHRKCPIFERNKAVKMIMAYNNIYVSYFEAENIINGNEINKETQYDRYNKPELWPQIGSKNKPSRINKEESTRMIDRQIQVHKDPIVTQNTRTVTLPSQKVSFSKNKEN